MTRWQGVLKRGGAGNRDGHPFTKGFLTGHAGETGLDSRGNWRVSV